MAFLEGYLHGLGLIILIGPVFFTLIQSTLEYGFRSGFAVAFGIFISDIVCVGLLYGLGAGKFFQDPDWQRWMAIAGGVIVIVLGLKYVLTPAVETNLDKAPTAGDYLQFLMKGFLVNFVNPFVFGAWLAFIALAGSKFEAVDMQMSFLAGMLVAILTTDTIKAALAHKIKVFMEPKWLKRAFQLIGLSLLAFGLYLLISFI